jgi:hypothetical protein
MTFKVVSAAVVAASLSLAGIAPATSAPITSPANPGFTAPITLASHRDVRRFGEPRYYKGYKGSREHRRGYRRHSNGLWFPLAAFGLGAIIGGTVNRAPAMAYGGNAHVSWCYDRYRSYRAYDNTFQPYNGPRRLCYSPFG